MIRPYLEAGKLVTTHGVRGELKMELWCGEAALLRRAKTLYGTADGGRPVQVHSLRQLPGSMALIKLAGVEDMDAARRMVGSMLYFDRNDVKLARGVCFISDLLGCEVRDADTGRVYGTVKSITHPGPQDIYTVTTPDGERMFPGVPAFLKAKCPEEGYILVTPIPGMFDDDAVVDKPQPEEA